MHNTARARAILADARDMLGGNAVEPATRIARNAPLAVAAIKRAVNERTAFDDQDAFRQQDQIVAPVLTPRMRRKVHAPSPKNAHPTGRDAEHNSPEEVRGEQLRSNTLS